MPESVEIRPQPGPQEQFLASPADLAIYGGAAGGGKSWALLLEPVRHLQNPDFGAVIFRRTSPEVTNEGGLWDESAKLYPLLDGVPKVGTLDWEFPSGANVGFRHLQHEETKFNWHGAQVPLIEFDELTRFTESQFWYLLSRNRSTCGVRPYVRASCNPDAGSWVAGLVAWWIDQDTGFPIPERAGRLRWFYRADNLIHWYDSASAAKTAHPELAREAPPKSLTFIPARLEDNQELLRKDPGYLANLLALPHVEQQRLLRGNWKVSDAEGEWPPDYFLSDIWAAEWPARFDVSVMALDPSKGKDAKFGDYSAYVFLGLTGDGMLWVDADLARRPTPVIAEDGLRLFRQWRPMAFAVEINQFQELIGVELLRLARERRIELPVFGITNMGKKPVRIRTLGPLLAQRRLKFRVGPGTRLLVQQLRDFPTGEFDDGPDALEMAKRMLEHLLGQRGGTGEPEALRA